LAACIFADPSRPDAPRWLVRATVVFMALVFLGTVAYGVLWFQAPAPSQWTAVK
jgi:phage shock protein PspC (stress-responsive transcriptional regulator)